MYVELKTGHSHDGPAWIALVRFSKTGRSVHFQNRELARIKGGGGSGNFVDVASGEQFWPCGSSSGAPHGRISRTRRSGTRVGVPGWVANSSRQSKTRCG
jgi:hypothetical protein